MYSARFFLFAHVEANSVASFEGSNTTMFRPFFPSLLYQHHVGYVHSAEAELMSASQRLQALKPTEMVSEYSEQDGFLRWANVEAMESLKTKIHTNTYKMYIYKYHIHLHYNSWHFVSSVSKHIIFFDIHVTTSRNLKHDAFPKGVEAQRFDFSFRWVFSGRTGKIQIQIKVTIALCILPWSLSGGFVQTLSKQDKNPTLWLPKMQPQSNLTNAIQKAGA